VCPTTPAGPTPSGIPAQDDERIATAADWIDAVFAPSPFTALSNLSGQPSVSLPLGESPDGMPIGVMLTAQTLREDLLIAVAAELERTMPWAGRRPSIHASSPGRVAGAA
jgi:amidase